MGERTIELSWNCGDCDTYDILGRHKRCPSCGSPREKGEMQMGGVHDYGPDGNNVAPTVTDPALLSLATAPPDWFCVHCEAGNIGNGDRCASCGAPRYGLPKEDHPAFARAGGSVRIREGGPIQGTPVPPPPAATRRTTSDFGPTRVLLGGLVFGFLALIVGVFVWASRTHEVVGIVDGVHWVHTTIHQRWQDTTLRAFQDETRLVTGVPPSNGSGEVPGMALLGDCREEHHHYETYQCGTQPESYECGHDESYSTTCQESESYPCGETCRDNGNGFATCSTRTCSRSVSRPCTRTRYVSKTCSRTVPRYCDRSIEATKCTYVTQEWVTLERRDKSSTTLKTTWDMPSTGALDRVLYKFDHDVRVRYEDGGKTHYKDVGDPSGPEPLVATTRAEAYRAVEAFQAWAPGRPVYLRINNLGGVADYALEPWGPE